MERDRLCVVTGTSSGIGLAVAELLLQRGWRVLGLARREAALRDAHYTHVQLDLADGPRVETYFTESFAREFPAQRFRCIGLVNNAALLEPVAPLPKLALGDLARAHTVNVVVPIWLTGFLLGHCLPEHGGSTPVRIVNVSSGAATNPRAGWASYCSSKAALLMAGRVFADEAQARPATLRRDAALLSFEPGLVDTPMQTQVRGASTEDFPSVQRFLDFHAQGKLQSAARPARDIADFLEREHAPPFSEGRSGG